MCLRCLHLYLSVLCAFPRLAVPVPEPVTRAAWPYHYLPVFVHAPRPLADGTLFRPVSGSVSGAYRSVPHALTHVLLPPFSGAWSWTGEPALEPHGVHVWCGPRAISVRVDRRVLGSRYRADNIYLGTCGLSRASSAYFYFHYNLHECGTRQESADGQLLYYNTLRYIPQAQGDVLRESPFAITLQCFYDRFYYSYKVGYLPVVNKGTFFKSLRSKRMFQLTACTAHWEKLPPNEGFVLGKQMFFEASAAHVPPDKRLFVNSCHASPSKDPSAVPRMDVVMNYGCLVDSKRTESHSRFTAYKDERLRFTVDSFLFPEASAELLYLHCSLKLGNITATPSAKACTFSRKAQRWQELLGDDSACFCCDSECGAPGADVKTMITSEPWLIIQHERDVVVVPVKLEPTEAGLDKSEEVLEGKELPLEGFEMEPSVWHEDEQDTEDDYKTDEEVDKVSHLWGVDGKIFESHI